MRKIIEEQMQLGQIDISSVEIELDTRDELPQLLRGLQQLYMNKLVRSRIFRELECLVPLEIDPERGRRGMDLWRIFVLGCVRLICNWDYDKLQEIANNHRTLRHMLGHGCMDYQRYARQTLNDNLRWFTPQILQRINRIVVISGRTALGRSRDEKMHCRCDSFVVETDVHYPTDINLLWDAVRKSLQLSDQLSRDLGSEGWRQTGHNLRRVKRLFRAVQKHRSKDRHSRACMRCTREYVEESRRQLARARSLIGKHRGGRYDMIRYFVTSGEHQIRLIVRRCFKGERISHGEKVFSLFEPHTEWISKGKAGVPQELGLRVAVVESDDGFILHHRVMQQETDDQVGAELIRETKRSFASLSSCSMDKAFWEPNAYKDISARLDICVIPKKGKLSAAQHRRENAPQFKLLRRTHAGVESAINALENHGLDRCLDYGMDGYERYGAMAVVARNIQLLGSKLQARERKRLQRRRRRLEAAA